MSPAAPFVMPLVIAETQLLLSDTVTIPIDLLFHSPSSLCLFTLYCSNCIVYQLTIMSFSGLNTVRKIVAKLPKFQLQELRGDIFGQLPILNVKTGANQLRKTNTGYYIARYYLEPIEKAARLVSVFIYLYLYLYIYYANVMKPKFILIFRSHQINVVFPFSPLHINNNIYIHYIYRLLLD